MSKIKGWPFSVYYIFVNLIANVGHTQVSFILRINKQCYVLLLVDKKKVKMQNQLMRGKKKSDSGCLCLLRVEIV